MKFSPQIVLVMAGLLVLTSRGVEGHGRLYIPPSRATMWRLGYSTVPNYSDNQMFCGGVQVQYNTNGGKCGICGDPFNGAREHEAGGRYASGIIVQNYTMGGVIDVRWELTANHKGWVEFKICPNNDVSTAATQECLDQYVLYPVGEAASRIMVPPSVTGYYEKTLQLPADLQCSQCVLQWRYHAANSWGCDSAGVCCVGCGDQEEFYACSDVMIGENVQQMPEPTMPDVPIGNDPNMDDYEDWDWDTTPSISSTDAPGNEDPDDGTGGSGRTAGQLAVICMMLCVSLM